jgi:hypothetical protein
MDYETFCSVCLQAVRVQYLRLLDLCSFLSLTLNRDLGTRFQLVYNFSSFLFLYLPKMRPWLVFEGRSLLFEVLPSFSHLSAESGIISAVYA